MTEKPINLFWDSCVFIRYLTGNSSEKCFQDICQWIEDAKDKKVIIHFSTVALAEIKPSHLYQRGFGDANDFLADFQSSFSPIGPSPDVLIRAGSVRDIMYANPNGGPDRVLGTADAIHLLTCIYARDALGIADIEFHTLDEGKGGNWEGKCVPLLNFEKWAVGARNNHWVKEICKLPRKLPAHPQTSLFSAPPNAS